VHSLPSAATMYKALVNRDSSFEGIFFVGVKTTGIFCRPTCPAKKPKSENVEFFRSTQDALYAGYRPCARCAPMVKEKPAPELVKKLCELIEKSPTGRICEQDLRDLKIDPSTARRQFLKYYGMTFQAYHRARRMGLALHTIRKGESVIGTQIDHGYDSASGFWEAFKQQFGRPPSKAESVNCLMAKWIDSPLGPLVAVADDAGLHLLEFVDRRGLEKEIAALRKRTKSIIVPGTNRHLDQIVVELDRYFGMSNSKFTVPLVIAGTEFERNVWKQLQLIPPGTTRSYRDLAIGVGSPNAVRAVGRANGRNCLAIVIPCHRVIRSDGTLCGYGGGIWRKQWLIDHEASQEHLESAHTSTQRRQSVETSRSHR
jgi:AraC family transcriptional regulator of adaptative response/methylated-DNA-[protein]-cysteine methyltransferase